jgi:hypothetical protein
LRQRPELGFHLADLLRAVLQDEQLLPLGLSARTVGARVGNVNLPGRVRARYRS